MRSLSFVALACVAALALAYSLLRRPPPEEVEVATSRSEASRAEPAVVELVDPSPQIDLTGEAVPAQRVGVTEPDAPAVTPSGRRVALRGRVVEERDGAPVAGVVVTLSTRYPERNRGHLRGPVLWAPEGTTTTDATGSFVFEGLEPGWIWQLVCEASPRPGRTSTGTLPREGVAETTLALRDAWYALVRLKTDAGPLLWSWSDEHPECPIDDLDLGLFVSEESPGLRLASSERGGVVRLGATHRRAFDDSLKSWFDRRSDPDRFDTPVEVSAPGPAWISFCVGPDVLAGAAAPGPGKMLELVVPVDRLPKRVVATLRVVDQATGTPIVGARAGLRAPGTFGPAASESDAEGVVRIDGVQSGRRWLTVLASGYQWLQHEIVVPDTGREVDLGTLALSCVTAIRGHLVGPACAAVEVHAFPLERFDATRDLRRSFAARPDAPGYAFEFRGLGRERYLLRLEGGEAAARPLVVDASRGDVGGVELVCERGNEVRFEFAEPLADGLLRVETDDGLPVLERDLARAREIAVRLVPGRYAWRIDAPGAKGTARDLVVGTRDPVVAVPGEGER